MNNYKKMACIALAALLVSCGAANNAKEGTAKAGSSVEQNSQSLVYAFPMDDQTETPVSSPVILRFSSGVVATDLALQEGLIEISDGTNSIDYSVARADNDQSLILTPEQKLSPSTQYTVEIGSLDLAKGSISGKSLSFTTQGDAKSLVAANPTFEISRLIPDGANYEVIEFSSFRLQLSQPVAPESVNYGSSLELRTSGGQLVPAQVLVDGFYITVDPTSDLQAGAEYTLTVSDSVTSIYGTALVAQSFDLRPVGTGERAELVLEVKDSDPQDNLDVLTSVLTGAPINVVPLSSVLLGDTTSTQVGDLGINGEKGLLLADLADLSAFEGRGKPIPIRVKAGSLLQGAAIDLLVGGVVPLDINSGLVNIQIISDGVGYLFKNPYSRTGLRQVQLFLDVAITTADDRANGAVTQNVLHLQMVGTTEIEVDASSLVLNAVSVVELDILGLETASSILSFYTATLPNQNSAPKPPVDIVAPTLQSWVPGALDAYTQRANEPLVLTFNEPVRAASDAVELTSIDGVVPMSYYVDGASVVIKPEAPLEYGVQYSLQYVSGMIEDYSGNTAAGGILSFSLPVPAEMSAEDGNQFAPVVLATYPGFPCTVVDFDLTAGDMGVCLGGRADDVSRRGGRGAADPNSLVIPGEYHLPLARMPANRTIKVVFSREIDPASVTGTTFYVERVASDGNPLATVPGSLSVSGNKLEFTPQAAWQEGEYYRYTLASNEAAPVCGNNAICDLDGLPLHTLMLPSAPASSSILLEFDRNIDPVSVNSTTFELIDFDTGDPVAGSLSTVGNLLVFTPQAPFKEEGEFYEYTLMTNGVSPNCGVNTICDTDGQPLLSTVDERLQDVMPSSIVGGPLLQVYFQGIAETEEVLLNIANMPSGDSNANFVKDAGEPVASLAPDAFFPDLLDDQSLLGDNRLLNSARLTPNFDAQEGESGVSAQTYNRDGSLNSDDLVNAVNIGCGFNPDETPISCPDANYMHVTSSLFVEMVGYVPPTDGRIADDDSVPAIVQQQGGVLAYVNPALLVGSGIQATVMEGIDLLSVAPIDVGYAAMRIRPSCDASVPNACGAPDYGRVKGWIVEENGRPQFITNLDLYLDLPILSPFIETNADNILPVAHYMRSYPLNVGLTGEVSLTDDGRLVIQAVNTEKVELYIDVEACTTGYLIDFGFIEAPDGCESSDPYFVSIFLQIAPKDLVVGFISEPIKK